MKFTKYIGTHDRVSGSRIRYFARDGELCPACAKRNARDKGVNPWDWNAPVAVVSESDTPDVERECIDVCSEAVSS